MILGVFPDIETLESAPIEDIAFTILEQAKRSLHNGEFHAGNLIRGIEDQHSPHRQMNNPQVTPLSYNDLEKIRNVVIEAISWLAAERLIAEDHTQDGRYIITKLGNAVRSKSAMSSYAKRAYLPHDVLLTQIEEVALAPFLAGRYDEAVRAAFTRLETTIRDGASYGHDEYGVPMVRKAFYAGAREDPESLGPLTDPDLEYSEREGVAHLFAGAMGFIKNPLSHRELNIEDARLAASRILLANDLMITLAGHVQKRQTRSKGER